MKFQNPIIPGFAPDPSIAMSTTTHRYFLVNSSFQLFPGLPIYTSTDLSTWHLINHAILRPSQLDLSGAFSQCIPLPDEKTPLVVTGGLFAPTIRYHNGMFYIVCTNAYRSAASVDTKGEEEEDHFQSFLVTCPEEKMFDLDGWSDPIWIDLGSEAVIDPGLLFDDTTEKVYFHASYRKGPLWAPDCSIRGFEIDVATGKALTETKLMWRGREGKKDVEGPHLYKKDGWFYLVVADGSTFDGHEIDVARSRHVWGPYESFKGNPLLTAFGKRSEYVQWTGHGDLFQDIKSGKWFCVHLGVRCDIESGHGPARHPLGRETFITPVRWDKGEWPEIAQTKMEFEVQDDGRTEDLSTTSKASNSTAVTIVENVEDLFIRNPSLKDYQTSANTYSLRPRSADLSVTAGTTTFVGRRQRSLNCIASATLVLDEFFSSPNAHGICAGITVFKDCLRHASLYYDSSTSQLVLDIIGVEQQKKRPSSKVQVPSHLPAASTRTSRIFLQITAQPAKYVFSWKTDNEGGVGLVQSDSESLWQSLGEVDSVVFSGHDMTGTIFGLFATSHGNEVSKDERPWILFEDFTIGA